MEERSRERWENNYAVFYGDLTEEEQKYRDYFETDLEMNPENEQIQEKIDEMKLLVEPEYQLDRYDFQETYTITPEEDQSSLIQKKAFKFQYRLASDSLETFQRRNNRMIERHLTRYEQKGIQAVTIYYIIIIAIISIFILSL
jgi:hypothetical protein